MGSLELTLWMVVNYHVGPGICAPPQASGAGESSCSTSPAQKLDAHSHAWLLHVC